MVQGSLEHGEGALCSVCVLDGGLGAGGGGEKVRDGFGCRQRSLLGLGGCPASL